MRVLVVEDAKDMNRLIVKTLTRAGYSVDGCYNGEEALPSTIESAIVHMVDGLLKKLEVLDEDTVGSNWNQDMVIYQTLNEYSAAGLYDRSGLSMNMFLKIREYLVNEEALLV